MGKRWTRKQILRLLREADRDLGRGLTVGDVCRKLGVSPNSYHRWRRQHDPDKVDDARCIRELQVEVERLKRLVAELLLDKTMLLDVAKKSGDGVPAACGGGVPDGDLRHLGAASRAGARTGTIDAPLSPARA